MKINKFSSFKTKSVWATKNKLLYVYVDLFIPIEFGSNDDKLFTVFHTLYLGLFAMVKNFCLKRDKYIRSLKWDRKRKRDAEYKKYK